MSPSVRDAVVIVVVALTVTASAACSSPATTAPTTTTTKKATCVAKPAPDAAAEPACTGNPEGVTLSFALPGGVQGLVAHWTLACKCIPVTYDKSVEPLMPKFEAAFEAWSHPTVCSTSLCFDKPKLVTTRPNSFRSGGIFIATDAAVGEDNSLDILVPATTANVDTGTIFGAEILVSASATDKYNEGMYAYAVGASLGFAVVDETTKLDTVLVSKSSTRRTLGADDIASVCGVYGTTPFCEK